MKIIIIGAGRVGESVADSLVSEHNDITVIDTSAARLRDLESRFDLRGVVGSGIDPAVLAEAGARDYLAAFARRCGRPLTPAELRRAMADGDGDPALMALIRANHLGDTTGREQLAGQIRCSGKAAR